MRNKTIDMRSYGSDEGEVIPETVVEVVAEAEGTSPLELPPLVSVVDPDALASLFRGRDCDGSIAFDYHGYRVCLYADGQVALSDAAH